MMRKHLIGKAGLLTTLLTSAALPAQVNDRPSQVAQPTSDAMIRKVEQQASAITRIGDLSHDPVARFSRPVCPSVIGLPADLTALIAERIRADAARVGAAADRRQNCEANIVVAFVRNGEAEIKALMKKSSYLFGPSTTSAASAVLSEAGPARAWNVTEVRARQGETTGSIQRGPVLLDGPIAPSEGLMMPSSDSHIFLTNRLDINHSIVIIDVKAIDGMSVNQIADYVAIRSLAPTRTPSSQPAIGTILSLFDPSGDRPAELMPFDVAYLRGLYRSGGNLPGIAMIGEVVDEYKKEQSGPAARF